MINILCSICKNYQYGIHCKAFPEGIPREVLSGKIDHTKPVEGDNGIQFENMFEDKTSEPEETGTPEPDK